MLRDRRDTYLGESLLYRPGPGGEGGFVEHGGERWYRIANYHVMRPFLVALLSAGNHWQYLSSTGGLTCGRRDPDGALFPYETDDRLHDACNTTGPLTLLRIRRGGRVQLWQPFAAGPSVYVIERNLYKNLAGNRIRYQEINHDLGLGFSWEWTASERFGFVRAAILENKADSTVVVDVLDGLRNLLPAGVNSGLQATMSTLLDAYKQAETVADLPAALYTLSSIPTDRAEPSEALRASVAWCAGMDGAEFLLSDNQLDAFRHGLETTAENAVRGQRCAFFVRAVLTLKNGEHRRWYIAADVGLGHRELSVLLAELRNGVTPGDLASEVQEGTRAIRRLAGAADGLQASAEPLLAARHHSNALFNIMRGGVFAAGYEISRRDFVEFLAAWNRPLARRLAETALPDGPHVSRDRLLAAAERSGDPDLQRIALEYLPLTFSRRHGDPSRPWNRFTIETRDEDGSERLAYEGNWRDIFQNWEALAVSYPHYIDSFIARFVNASTADGYNPYRLGRHGFDWEVPDPGDPWSNIGYWGDHQVNYLVFLLEFARHHVPNRLQQLLQREIFVYADVPYRIRSYEQLRADPRNSIDYDDDHAGVIAQRIARRGSDGRLMAASEGLLHVNLLEKLLVPALVKLSNLVPGGGIWMNTQRPEWNDANNALAGYGLSLVTLCYLRRYLWVLRQLLEDSTERSFRLSTEVAEFLTGLQAVLDYHLEMLRSNPDDARRERFVDAAGHEGETYRARVYAGLSGRPQAVQRETLLAFLELALRYVDHGIAAGRRGDGLYHSYSLLRFDPDGCAVEPLQLMLEGQVAALGSGCLEPEASLALLDALRASDLYDTHSNSYLLYPDRKAISFLNKNVIEEIHVERQAWLRRELESGRAEYVVRDADGVVRFSSRFRNAAGLRRALEADADFSRVDREAACRLFENVFDHRRFTGRSASMAKYEGLGCVYWHMVSKLALAVQQACVEARESGAAAECVEALSRHCEDIVTGLGLHKAPREYGAFPIDPYSHTPGFAGVQQPGMTGQVKEDLLWRYRQLGAVARDGCLYFEPVLLSAQEFLQEEQDWSFVRDGEESRLRLAAGSLAFTLCGVPVVYRLDDRPSVEVITSDGEAIRTGSSSLGPEWSRLLFERDPALRRIDVRLLATQLRQRARPAEIPAGRRTPPPSSAAPARTDR